MASFLHQDTQVSRWFYDSNEIRIFCRVHILHFPVTLWRNGQYQSMQHAFLSQKQQQNLNCQKSTYAKIPLQPWQYAVPLFNLQCMSVWNSLQVLPGCLCAYGFHAGDSKWIYMSVCQGCSHIHNFYMGSPGPCFGLHAYWLIQINRPFQVN